MEKIYLAQTSLGRIGGADGFGPFGNLDLGDVSAAAGAFTTIISNVIGIMTIIAGIWFIFMFIVGAFGYLTAGGDSKKIGDATRRIGTALTGLIVIVIAYALISLIGGLLGFDILNPQDIIIKLKPGG
ncbi:MAG: hypothetical protein MUP45_03390 [Candidatus Marinimicrobia bacterium]|nr:hypothetical protein [Candidatus Neomarinimicrobiota bacterium]